MCLEDDCDQVEETEKIITLNVLAHYLMLAFILEI